MYSNYNFAAFSMLLAFLGTIFAVWLVLLFKATKS